jgi:hypothetical protein
MWIVYNFGITFMIKRLFVLAIVTLLLTGCILHHHDIKPAPKSKPKPPLRVKVKQKTSEFTKIQVVGDIDVVVHTNSRGFQIVLRGDSRDVVNTKRYIKDNELVVSLGKGYPKGGRLKVDIYLRHLTGFAYHGSGFVVAKGILSKCMDLLIDNKGSTLFEGSFGVRRAVFMSSGRTKLQGIRSCVTQFVLLDQAKVKLVGYANVATLQMSGASRLSLYWVKSKSIKVNLKDHSRAQMAGVAETLHADLWGEARFNGRHLMSKNSFVKTHGKSEADISVSKNQHTLAQDKSNIYYYFLPEAKTDFMAEEGSVLDMREWERPFLKSPSRYNR